MLRMGVFGKEAEHQPCHEVVHVVAAFVPGPLRVFAQQLNVHLVQAARGAHVDRVVPDFLDGGNTRQGQEEAKMIGEIRVSTGNGLTANQILGFQHYAIGGEDKLSLSLRGGRAGPQRIERFTHLARFAHSQMDIVALENSAGHIRLVVVTTAQALDGDVLVAESGQKGERELRSIKRQKGKIRDGLFDFYGIHFLYCLMSLYRVKRAYLLKLPDLNQVFQAHFRPLSQTVSAWT